MTEREWKDIPAVKQVWLEGVGADTSPEQWASTPSGAVREEEEYHPRLTALARALGWRRSLRELLEIVREHI